MIKNKFLILYNPVSCNGKALKILKKLEIDFNKMNFEYESIQTNYPGHMTDLCATNKFEKIIIIGGDGTLNEALNGIMINPINKQQKFGFIEFTFTINFYKNIKTGCVYYYIKE